MRCAAGLAKLGVEKGDRVALLVGNNSEFVILNLAIPALGAIMVPDEHARADARAYVHCQPLHAEGPHPRCRVRGPRARGGRHSLGQATGGHPGSGRVRAVCRADEGVTAASGCGGIGGRRGGDPVHIGHDRPSERRGADAPGYRAFRDELRGGVRAGPRGPLRRGRAAHPRDGPCGDHHAHGALRGGARHQGRLQGQGLPGPRRARAHHLHAHGAGDVQPVPAAAAIEGS